MPADGALRIPAERRRYRQARYRRIRLAVQGASLVLFLGCFGLAAAGVTGLLPVDLYFLADPLAAGSALLAGRALLPGALLAAAGLALATVVCGRFFCGYLCPMGVILDWSSPRAKGRQSPKKLAPGVSSVKYVLLVVVAVAALFGVPAAFFLDPLTLLWRGLALALWPMALWTGDQGLGALRSLTESWWTTNPFAVGLSHRVFEGAVLSAVLVAAMVALNRIAPRFWCRALCPLGALLGFLSRAAWMRRRRTVAECISCGRCEEVCQMGGSLEAPVDECLLCLRCGAACPGEAIAYRFSPPAWVGRLRRWKAGEAAAAGGLSTGTTPPGGPSRRQLLGAAAGALAVVATLDRIVQADDGSRGSGGSLRPPGSLPEPQFLERCLRCGVCMQACPTNILQPDVVPATLDGFFAPVLDMSRGGCDPDCRACGAVCPTQAIRALPLDQRRRERIGEAVVDASTCLRSAGEDCRICGEACPYDAVAIARIGLPVVAVESCNGCGLCEFRCPAPAARRSGKRAAIHIVPPGFGPPHREKAPDDGYLPPFLAARGERAPRTKSRDFSPDQGAKPQANRDLSRIWQRRAGGKGPTSTRSDFCHRLLG